MKFLTSFEAFLTEGVHFKDYEKVKQEITNAKGSYAIFKVQPEANSTISTELKPHIGKFVSVENSHGDNAYTKVDSLLVWKQNGSDYECTNEKIQNLGEAGDLNFLELVAIVSGSNNPRKIKNEKGEMIENPNFKPNQPFICKVLKTF